jgi:nicotinate-nucleotide adenylyltransferase
MKRRIGFLGGTFDPIHLGHLILAQQLVEQFQLKKVLFIPSAAPPHKDDIKVSPTHHRFEMTRAAVEDNRLFEISDIELKREGKSYTIDTITELKKLHPDSDLYFLAGSDVLTEFDTWKDPERIFEQVKVALGTRPGYDKVDMDNKFFSKTIMVEINGLHVSSTQVRHRVKEGKSIKYLVPLKVEEYIKAKGLYKE